MFILRTMLILRNMLILSTILIILTLLIFTLIIVLYLPYLRNMLILHTMQKSSFYFSLISAPYLERKKYKCRNVCKCMKKEKLIVLMVLKGLDL